MANPEVQQTVDDALTALPDRLQRFRPGPRRPWELQRRPCPTPQRTRYGSCRRPALNGDGSAVPDVGASAAGSVGAGPLYADRLSPAAISALDGRLDLLVRLGAAHDSGVLTDAGFDREESRLMGV